MLALSRYPEQRDEWGRDYEAIAPTAVPMSASVAPDLVAVAEPARLQSAFIHGIKRLPVGWSPPG